MFEGVDIHPVEPSSLPAKEFQERIKKLIALRQAEKLDAVLLTNEITNYYFTGISSDNGILLLTEDEPVYLTDFRYLVTAKRIAPWLKTDSIWPLSKEPEALQKLGAKWKRVGFEGDSPLERFVPIIDALENAEFVNIKQELLAIRAVKSKAEIACIAAAAETNSMIFDSILKELEPGATEWEVATQIRIMMTYFGQGEAFETIVCSGKNAAECHHIPDDTALRKSRCLLIDMGVKVNHYCSDMTRSFYMSDVVPKKYREIHDIATQASISAISEMRPGMRCCDVDAIAREVIDKAGYGKAFGHSLGHGVGLEVHEAPNLSSKCDTVLEPGMIVTVEPGIYLPDEFGVRIEDLVVIKPNGCELLSTTPHFLSL